MRLVRSVLSGAVAWTRRARRSTHFRGGATAPQCRGPRSRGQRHPVAGRLCARPQCLDRWRARGTPRVDPTGHARSALKLSRPTEDGAPMDRMVASGQIVRCWVDRLAPLRYRAAMVFASPAPEHAAADDGHGLGRHRPDRASGASRVTITEATHALAALSKAKEQAGRWTVPSHTPMRLVDAITRVEPTWVEAVAVVQAVCAQLAPGQAAPDSRYDRVSARGDVSFIAVAGADDDDGRHGGSHGTTADGDPSLERLPDAGDARPPSARAGRRRPWAARRRSARR